MINLLFFLHLGNLSLFSGNVFFTDGKILRTGSSWEQCYPRWPETTQLEGESQFHHLSCKVKRSWHRKHPCMSCGRGKCRAVSEKRVVKRIPGSEVWTEPGRWRGSRERVQFWGHKCEDFVGDPPLPSLMRQNLRLRVAIQHSWLNTADQ